MIDALYSEAPLPFPPIVVLTSSNSCSRALVQNYLTQHGVVVADSSPVGVLLDDQNAFASDNFPAFVTQHDYRIIFARKASVEYSDYLWSLEPEALIVGDLDLLVAVASAAVPGKRFRHPEPQPSTLTRAEHAVLRLVACGQSSEEVAATLCLSKKTVRNHLTSIYRKLQLRNNSAAILYYWGWGWLSG